MGFTLDYGMYEALARQVVEEGAVLLRNETQALPLAEGTRVAVFGRMQNHYYKSGTGSGGMVNAPRTDTLLGCMRRASGWRLDEELTGVYRQWERENPYEDGVGWGMEPWSQKEMPLSAELLWETAGRNDAAVVILARTAGEDRDNQGAEGSYLLSEGERRMLAGVCGAFSRVAVVCNVGNIIDFSWVDEYRPQAVLLAWQGGMMGAEGTVELLTGRANPSGKLTDTVARRIGDYPSHANFGDRKRNVYQEDIYVGYRYFETAAQDRVLYPFGFGLSYTTFDCRVENAAYDGEYCFVSVRVTNTGSVSGKEVVQVYMEAPQGRLGKPARVLAGFEKTGLLAPGESEVCILSVTKREYASYDDAGATAYPSAWVLEAGAYRMYVGSSVRDAVKALEFTLDADEPVEQLSEAMKPAIAFERFVPEETAAGLKMGFAPVPVRSGEAARRKLADVPYTGDQGWKLADVLSGKVTMERFLAQLTEEELACIVRGEGMGSARVTPGTASAFGGVSDALAAYGIPCGCCSDGPSGLRLDVGTKAFSFPNGTMIACTYNPELVEELFAVVGTELLKNKVDTLLGPGMNIHRHPYNGRNFEYFSEDPFLTGRMAVAELSGLASVGVTGTLKHFCGNNQETNRYSLDSVVSERALREIYLRGFEIAVREGGAFLLMTTYGRVNGLWTATDYELNTVVLREQWGFDGMVMTDWWASLNERGREDEPGFAGSKTNFAAMVAAQNDVYMCCPDGSKNDHGDNTLAQWKAGVLSRAELCRSAANICGALLRLPTMLRLLGCGPVVTVVNAGEDWEERINEDVTYFTLEDTAEISGEGIDTSRGSSFAFGLKLARMGGYRMEIAAVAEGSELSQLPVTLFCSGVPVQTVVWNGSGGSEVTKTVRLYFNSNFAIDRLYFGQNGLKVRQIRLVYEKTLDEALASGDYLHG